MHYLVYRTFNSVNWKYYTGAHKTKEKWDDYLGSGRYFKNALKKYGRGAFIKVILYEASSEEEMFQKEKELVDVGPHSYNICPGGNGGWKYVNTTGKNVYPGIGKGHCGEQNLIKSREVFKYKIKEDKEFRKKFSEAVKKGHRHLKTFLGKRHTQETKRKIGCANAISQYGDRNSQYGKKKSDEVKDRIRKSMLLYHQRKNKVLFDVCICGNKKKIKRKYCSTQCVGRDKFIWNDNQLIKLSKIKSLREIAKELNVSHVAVHKRLKKILQGGAP